MEGEVVKWLFQQAPAVVVSLLFIRWLFKLIEKRDERDARFAEELKGMAETLSTLSTTLGLLFHRIRGGGGGS